MNKHRLRYAQVTMILSSYSQPCCANIIMDMVNAIGISAFVMPDVFCRYSSDTFYST